MGNAISPRLENAEKTGVLQLSHQHLKKVPEQLKRVQLRSLDLSFNKIESIDGIIGHIKNLKVLILDNNRIKYIPDEINLLTKLETLSSSHNELVSFLSGSYVSLNALTHLHTVNLSNNFLTEFPVQLCSTSIPLNLLDLSHNQISLVPSCVSSLQCVELNLNHNRISIIPVTLGQCSRLKVLRLESNSLTLDNFPSEILVNSQISVLCLDGNPLNVKELYNLPGYAKYMERFTAMKKKVV